MKIKYLQIIQVSNIKTDNKYCYRKIKNNINPMYKKFLLIVFIIKKKIITLKHNVFLILIVIQKKQKNILKNKKKIINL